MVDYIRITNIHREIIHSDITFRITNTHREIIHSDITWNGGTSWQYPN